MRDSSEPNGTVLLASDCASTGKAASDSKTGANVRTALFVLKLLITASLLWFISRQMTLDELKTMIAGSDVRFAILGLAVLALQPLIGTLRWIIIAQRVGARVSVPRALAVTYVGTFFNQALPATVGGDALRTWLLHRLGAPLLSSATSVALDRIAMLFTLVLVVAVGAAGVASGAAIAEFELPALALLISFIAAIAVVVAAEALPRSWRARRVVRALIVLAADTRRVLFDPAMALAVVAISFVGIVNLCACVYFFALALSHPLNPLEAIVLVPTVVLVSSLPISLGGWGAREFAMVAALSTVGIPSSASLVVSIMVGVSSIVVSLPGAPCYLFLRRVRAAEQAA